jgi:NAD-dependent SIR2 family protein deacetylase
MLNICISGEMISNILPHATKLISEANAVLITAGAGIGVDSGLPDFRGNEGFWRAYPPLERLGISFYEIANPQWFDQDPALAWGFYGHRLNLYRSTTPHSGFALLYAYAKTRSDGYFVFTSNIDGQFQNAGFSNDRIEECHGSIHYLQCSHACTNDIWSADDHKIDVDEDTFRASEPFPLCPHCSSIARPNILMFGDWGWISERTMQQNQNLTHWLNELKTKNSQLVIIEVGAGEAVPTVRHLSEGIAAQHAATLIRINPRDCQVPAGHYALPLGAAEGIKQLLSS